MFRRLVRSLVLAALLLGGPAVGSAQEPVRLVERFDPAEPYRVELRVTLSGRLSVPAGQDKPPQTLPVNGASTLVYDERVLPPEPGGADRAVRQYREVTLRRAVDGKDQEAEVRPAVRRMVVLRSDKGKKAPFSPDGPLTWGEIDLVRTDLFSPVLVAGLLPPNPVRPGDSWPVSAAAVAELTDLDPVKAGGLSGAFVGFVTLEGRRYAKLSVTGTVSGLTEDGPSRHKLDGVGYFDLAAGRLAYLNLKGGHDLLDADGKAHGRIDGTFVLTRSAAGRVAELGDAALRDLELRPTPDNTLLLYDNPDLGVRFLYPRRWRVGAVQGKQLTLEEPSGGGVLVTIESADKLPTAEQYLAETRGFLGNQKWGVLAVDAPRRWAERPARVDRFALDAEVKGERVRLEYAVAAQPEGGATVAARLPWADRRELTEDVERLLKSLAVTKKISGP